MFLKQSYWAFIISFTLLEHVGDTSRGKVNCRRPSNKPLEYANCNDIRPSREDMRKSWLRFLKINKDEQSGRTGSLNKARRDALTSFKRRDAVNLLIVGSCRVGKSALVNRWVNGVFHEAYVPTVEEFCTKGYTFMGQRISVGLIDLSGSGEFPAMFDLYVTKTDSIMYVYEVGNESSVLEVRLLHDKVMKLRGSHHNLIQSIVGTKIDLLPDIGGRGYKSKVVDELLVDMGQPKHVVASAKLDLNVSEAFDNALSALVTTRLPRTSTITNFSKHTREHQNRTQFGLCWVKNK